MSATWTPEQQDAIRLRGRNLLVSAAAGAGKTSVLVERIVRRLLDPEDPLEIDRLLVVTFTEAAAGEMRERIGRRLEEAVAADPENARLRRQSALLARASISTLHAFCLRVIRQHFHRLELDPAVRALSEHEARLLRQEVLEQLCEEQCAARAPGYLDLVERYGGRHDEGVQSLVLQAHALAYSQPWPKAWLESCVAPFGLASDEPLPERWAAPIRLAARRVVERAVQAYSAALDLCRSPGGPLAWEGALEEERQQYAGLLALLHDAAWDDVGTALTAVTAGRATALRKPKDADEALCNRIRELRGEVARPAVKKLAEGVLTRPEAELARELRELLPVALELTRLVREFDAALWNAKAERGVIDFGDMERLALRLLLDPAAPRGMLRPSEIALGFRRRFEEVLIDEYQDINETQDAILQLVARDGADGAPNRFMVGDVKQSIYRFRLAEPRLFLEKYHAYAPARDRDGGHTSAPDARLDLNANFRSRRCVVDAVNFVFRQVMTASVGELDYAGEAELVFGADYPPLPGGAPADAPVELHLIDRSEGGGGETEGGEDAPDAESDSDAAGIELEAAVIAQRIRELVQGTDAAPPLQVWDRGLGSYRDARYRDVVILLRAASTQAPAMVEVLNRLGVPVYARATTGYFAALEVRVVLALLQVIDNPRQDLPLATVLRSPLVGASDEDLAHVRLAAPDAELWDAVNVAAASAGARGTRLLQFLADLERWRRQLHRGPLSRFIEDLYRKTGWLDYASGMPQGEQRRANLLALTDRAREFDQFARQGLYRFLRFVESLQDAGEDLGTAPAAGEGEDVVRVMTIHQSKGLEFPVVVVANLGGRFRNDSGDVLMDRELGLGPFVVNLPMRMKYPSVAHHALRERARAKGLAEEMRLLYVALTRARERLILTGTVKELATRGESWLPARSETAGPLPAALISAANSYLDWLGPVLARHPDVHSALGEVTGAGPHADDPSRWQLRSWSSAEAAALLPGIELGADPLWEQIAQGEPLGRAVPYGLREALLGPGPGYRFAAASAIPGKRTVSQIKRLFEAEEPGWAPPPFEPSEVVKIPRPRFLTGDEGIGAARGTATHTALEHLDLRSDCDERGLRQQLVRMVAEGVLLAEEASTISLHAMAWFFASPLGARLRAAPIVRREWMFTAAVPVEETALLPGAGESSGETVVVQGVIDCLFEEEGRMVLLDYKTDRPGETDPAVLAERHRKQLQLYGSAVRATYGREVSEAYLVYLHANMTVPVPLQRTT